MVDAAKAELRETGAPALWDAAVTAVHHDRADQILILDLDVEAYPGEGDERTPLALPGQPGYRVAARPLVRNGTHLAVCLDVDPDDPVALRYAQLKAGDHVHLGAPLDPVDEGAPDGRT
jgi:hypothetical protein